MLTRAINLLEDPLSQLCWIDKYCGLTRLAVRKTVKDGKAIRESYPVSCGCSSNDCWNAGMYSALAPNSDRKSVAYWVQNGASSISQDKRGRFEMKGKVDFVVWLNLKALGKEDCNFCEAVAADLLLTVNGRVLDDEVSASFDLSSVLGTDRSKNYFNKYSYGDIDALFWHPYEACVFTFDYIIKGSASCLALSTCETPIIC